MLGLEYLPLMSQAIGITTVPSHQIQEVYKNG